MGTLVEQWQQFADALSDTHPGTIVGLRPHPSHPLNRIWVKLGKAWWVIAEPSPVRYDTSTKRQGGPLESILIDTRTGTPAVARAIRMIRTRKEWKPFDPSQP